MGNGQREGMALLIFGVNTLAQSIELAQECKQWTPIIGQKISDAK